MNLEARWMKTMDFPQVMEIEQLCFEYPWTLQQFQDELRTQNVFGYVATTDDVSVLGVFVYELFPRRIEILDFAVHPSCWRRGIGTYMLDVLKHKLSGSKRTRMDFMVSDGNYAGHMFLKSQGFRCSKVIRKPWDTTDMDGYRFTYRVEAGVQA